MAYNVITLWQPWASWIAEGWKTIETRTHDKFRHLVGKPLLIHAGKKWDEYAVEMARPYMTPDQRHMTEQFRSIRGVIVCSAWVDSHLDCMPSDSAKALIECESKRYGLLLSGITKMEPPIPTKGAQGVWTYELEPITHPTER